MAGYPGAYEPCISVASIGPALKPAYYTNFDYGVDISAPGGSSIYGNGEIYSTVPSAIYGTNYEFMQGTSMACPMVSGVAALGLSYAKKLGKRFTANEFRSMLLASTNDISPYLTSGITVTYEDGTNETITYSDFDGKLGTGYVDAHKLLLQVEGTPYVTLVANKASSIDLTQYFGNGDYKFSKYEVSTEDKNAVGWSNASCDSEKLTVTCTKSGVATVTVTMLVGTGSQSNSSYPYPTEVTKKFVVMVRSSLASNNGWL
jgi:subtilisin family serine protease